MHLDMITMSAVNVSATAVLAGVLLFTWAREARDPETAARFVGSWGLAMLLQSIALAVILVAARLNNGDIVSLGASLVLLSHALRWHASRVYADRSPLLLWLLVGPIGFFFLAHSGLAESFGARLIAACIIVVFYNAAAALELKDVGEALPRRPAMALLTVTAVAYLLWIPFYLSAPIQDLAAIFTSAWFPGLVLVTLLVRIALGFTVLSMAKEREELEQRHDALTDSLTGLPNRRALFEAADAVGQRRILGGTPVSVLIFDLDHFKDTNDSYGHNLGDDVLKIFGKTVLKHIKTRSIVGRLGGEEFAAILPGADATAAVEAAEAMRRAFSRAAAFVNGLAVGGTVSVGVASDVEVDTDLSGLFRRADAALYVAKRGGRDQVALLESDDDNVLPGSTVRTSPTRRRSSQTLRLPVRTV